MSPRKALDQSLLQQFQCMRQFPGKSITILDFVSSESESGSETKSGPESEPEESDIEENDNADDEQQIYNNLIRQLQI